MTDHPLMVVGHKNPDTDSICAAISYAHLKAHHLEEPAIACRAGNVNSQTSFALSEFGYEAPRLLTDVYPKISDIMIGADSLITLLEDQTLGEAQKIITENRFTFLPVVDENRRCAGKITALRLAGLLREWPELLGSGVSVDLARFLETSGSIVCANPVDWFEGRVECTVLESQARSSQPEKGRDSRLLSIIASSDEAINRAIDGGAGVVILCGASSVANSVVIKAERSGASLIACPLPPLGVLLELLLAMPLSRFIDRDHPTFRHYDRVRDVQRKIGRYNEGGFVVLDSDDCLSGVITRISFLTQSRFRIVLVDHNEYGQSVDGIEDADVVEIIDHHRLGNRATDSPITFINKVVGSTCTIIAELYHMRGITPERGVAGLMLSAILSDTVLLNSPTAAALDHEMAGWLASCAGVEIDEYGRSMFAAGNELGKLDPDQIISHDLKIYSEGDRKFSVSQIEIVGFDDFHRIRADVSSALEVSRERKDCYFSLLMVTDITQYTSLLLTAGAREVIEAITYTRLEEGIFEMRNVLSRKKQLLPYLLDLLREL